MGSQTYWLWWMWTNIVRHSSLQWAYDLASQPKDFIVNAILDSWCMMISHLLPFMMTIGMMSWVVQHDDQPPFAIVNKVNHSWMALLTIMSFPSSHVFHDVGPIMVWDSCWVEPHVDGWEHAMRFHTHTTQVFGLSKAIKYKVLGQVMDLNYSIWVITLGLAKQHQLLNSHPPTSHFVSLPPSTFHLEITHSCRGWHDIHVKVGDFKWAKHRWQHWDFTSRERAKDTMKV
jgi:hypothetical protein